MSISVSRYEPEWQSRASALAAELRQGLGPLALRVDHIGSTAIAGMAAKPTFDLQVSVANLDAAVAAFTAPLADRGFERRPYDRDHVPAGRPDDPAAWAKRYWSRRRLDSDPVNLHVRVAGAPNERVALLFRDWFRAHPQAVPAYAQFKLALADAVADLGVYTEIKDPVVDLVIVAAEEWAVSTGWNP